MLNRFSGDTLGDNKRNFTLAYIFHTGASLLLRWHFLNTIFYLYAKKKIKNNGGRPDYFQRTCFRGASDMFLQYMNVVKCYYGNSNDCQIIIPALRLDGCWIPLISPYNCLWLNWRFRILLFFQPPGWLTSRRRRRRLSPGPRQVLSVGPRKQRERSFPLAFSVHTPPVPFFSLESQGKSDEGKFN